MLDTISRARRKAVMSAVVAAALSSLSACSSEPIDRPLPSQAKSPGPAPENGRLVVGKAPRANGGYASAIILTPQSSEDLPMPTEPVVMDQYGTAFHPQVLLARTGQPVEFRNSENLGHNVHVVDTATGATVFNVGTPVDGSGYIYRFGRPGIYQASCDIHPSMGAFILITSTPYAVVAAANGEFTIADVPPGSYHVTLWTVDPSRRRELEVEVNHSRTELRLEETQP